MLLGVCVVAVILALGWRWLVLPSRPSGDVLAATASSLAPSLPAPVPAAASSGVSEPPTSTLLRNVEDPRCVIRAAPSPELVDVETPAGDPAIARDPPSANAGRERLLQRLRTSDDTYANVVAIWLDVGEDDERRDERVRQLETLAASTRDPRLYSLALRSCWRKAGHECQSLSARRWSELDPDNALPWLMMMDEARSHRDTSGFQEALYHATHARRLAERRLAPAQAILDAASDDDPSSLVAAHSLAIDASGIAMAQVGTASELACRDATPSADANLWQQCIALVDLLEHRSDSLSARATGAAIDKRQTGNAEPANRVAAQMQKLSALGLESSSSCADLRGKLSLMRRMAVDGDMAIVQGAGR
jgi:hypothetical protein